MSKCLYRAVINDYVNGKLVKIISSNLVRYGEKPQEQEFETTNFSEFVDKTEGTVDETLFRHRTVVRYYSILAETNFTEKKFKHFRQKVRYDDVPDCLSYDYYKRNMNINEFIEFIEDIKKGKVNDF